MSRPLAFRVLSVCCCECCMHLWHVEAPRRLGVGDVAPVGLLSMHGHVPQLCRTAPPYRCQIAANVPYARCGFGRRECCPGLSSGWPNDIACLAVHLRMHGHTAVVQAITGVSAALYATRRFVRGFAKDGGAQGRLGWPVECRLSNVMP